MDTLGLFFGGAYGDSRTPLFCFSETMGFAFSPQSIGSLLADGKARNLRPKGEYPRSKSCFFSLVLKKRRLLSTKQGFLIAFLMILCYTKLEVIVACVDNSLKSLQKSVKMK